jgi:hypothetical protein
MDTFRDVLIPFVDGQPELLEVYDRIFDTLWQLHIEFDEMREKNKQQAKEKKLAQQSQALAAPTGPIILRIDRR